MDKLTLFTKPRKIREFHLMSGEVMFISVLENKFPGCYAALEEMTFLATSMFLDFYAIKLIHIALRVSSL